MKLTTGKIAALLIAGTSMSHAIIGFGGHWAPSMGTTLEGNSEEIFKQEISLNGTGSGDFIEANFNRHKSNNLNGFGIKLWIDAIPVIDIEATMNFQANTYKADFTLDIPTQDKIKQELSLEVPGADFLPIDNLDPAFGWMMTDLSVTYPWEFPLPIIQINVYIGGGVSYIYGTPIVNKKFMTDILTNTVETAVANAESGSKDLPKPEDIANEIINTFKDAEIHSGTGAHVMAGVRGSILFVPLAVYANIKYHLGGAPAEVSHGATLELGGGLAF